jgi:hypothetical protein
MTHSVGLGRFRQASQDFGHKWDTRGDDLSNISFYALEPKGALENGNIGSLTLRTVAYKVINAVLPNIGNPKPPKEPKTPRVV